MKFKYYVYVNLEPKGQEPKLKKFLEYEQENIINAGDVIVLEHDGPVPIMAWEVNQIPGTNEFIIIGGPPFR